MSEHPSEPTGGSGDDRENQVRDLQGVLRLSLQHVPTGSAPAAPPLDEERRQFLSSALQHAASGIADTLRAVLAVLAEPDSDRQLGALRLLRDHVDNIDIANDFEKMGGMAALRSALASERGDVRATAAGALADMLQHNPHCQQAAAANDLLTLLLRLVLRDPERAVRLAALQAVSALLRNNASGQAAFCAGDGCAALVSAMQSGEPRLQTRAAFLLGAACAESGELRRTALQVGLVEQAVGLLAEPHAAWHEHLLAALVSLAADGDRAAAECRRPELQLAEQLARREQQLAGRDEEQETLAHCRTLRRLCFSGEEAER